MREYNDSGVLGHAAMKADMDPKTARRYLRAGRGPQELKAKHDWRTRADPVSTIWAQAERMLQDAPELAAIDRLVHHASLVEFTGESHRATAAKAKGKPAVTTPAPS